MGNDRHVGPAQLDAKDLPEMRAHGDAGQAGLLFRASARDKGLSEMPAVRA